MEDLQDTYKDNIFRRLLGNIPKDWDIKEISDFTKFSQGVQVNVELQSSSPSNELIRFIRIVDYTQKTDDIRYVSKSYNKYIVNENDIVMIRYGTPGVIGRNIKGVIANNMFKISINNSLATNDYFEYFFKQKHIQEYLLMGSGSSTMPALNFSYLQKFQIALPPLPEQQKIASILSTVDEQISTTDKIIEKSKELKKGLMQKLFSEGIGHTEFKDTKIGRIPKDWEYVRIDEHINLFYGNAFKSSDFNEEGIGTKLLRGVNITVGRLRWTKKIDRYLNLPYEDYAKYGAEEGDLVISMDGSLVGRNFARVNKSDLPLLIVQRVACIRAKKSLNLEYLKQLVGSRMFLNYVDAVKTNSGIPHISGKDIKHFKIPFPSLEEQQKIADILSEADAKIEKEQTQKAHLEALKKGLMQQLLTGKKRVKV